MKKIVIVVVVLAALLVVAPWGVGKLAEERLGHGLDKLVEVAPYLKVVERKYTRGWFKSEQVVTFEVFSAWIKALEPKALERAMNKEGTDAGPGDEPAAPVDAPKLDELLRFTVRSEVLHGPVLGLSGFGIARADSQIVWSDKIGKKLDEIFGSKPAFEISTRVGFLGGGSTTFTSEGRTIKPKDSKAEVSWETFKLAIGYSKNVDKFDIDGKWPKFTVVDRSDQANFTMTNLTMDGVAKRVLGDLYDGDFKFGIERVSLGKSSGMVDLHALELIEVVETKSDFTNISIKMGTGEVKAKELADRGLAIKEFHYDVGLNHLHAPTVAKMAADMKALYSKPINSVAEVDSEMAATFKESGAELLKHDPEFVIDRIGIATPEGDGYIRGVIKLKGATPDDFATGSMALIGKIDANITIDVSEKMLQKFPNGSTGAGAMVDGGYARREGDRLICKIVFAHGQLTVNGKPQAIPGLGGPPSRDGEMSMPPRE